MLKQDVREICVIGGGPAGLAAAIAMKQVGYCVTLVDHAVPPVDKACGEGLMPDSMAALAELGISVPRDTGIPFSGIQFIGATSAVTASFPGAVGIGIRRIVLHHLLVNRAAALGVDLIWGAKRIDLQGRTVFVEDRRVPSQFVIGADGQNSLIRRRFGLDATVKHRRRYAFRRHYRIPPWSPYMQLYWGRKCQLYITPVAADEVCVVSMSQTAEVRHDGALRQFPELQARLAGVPLASRERGGLSVSRKLRQICAPGVALVGDASGSVDAITGEGICLSFKHAVSLARAMQSGKLTEYEHYHHALSRMPHFMAALMLTLDSHPEFQRRALASLQRHPNVFAALMRAHVGEQPLTRVLSWRLLPLCGAFLSA